MTTDNPVTPPAYRTIKVAPWPKRIRFVRIGENISIKVDVISSAVTLALVIFALFVGMASLGVSTTDGPGLSIGETWQVLTGQVAGDPADFVAAVLPGVTVALIGGASLALSGAVFQTVTRNPLGSPDIIGFTTGANTGALISMLVLHLNSTGIAFGALLGSLATGVVVWFFGIRGGGAGGYRLIIVGIALSAMLVAFNGYLIANSTSANAAAAASWGVGNLADLTMRDTVPIVITLIITAPLLLALSPRIRMFELGEDSAHSKGVDTGRVQILLLLLGVALAAATTAVAGPVAFVALVAPQLAARLVPSPGIPLITSAAVGAALLVTSNAIARTVLAPDTQLPVGVVTTAIGGVYLLGLLLAQSRKARP